MLAELTGEGYQVTRAEVQEAVGRHPAFSGSARSRISIGKSARAPLGIPVIPAPQASTRQGPRERPD
jgi:hypothetical protein